MSIPVVLAGTTYNIPQQGESPPWGSELSDFLVAVAALLNSLQGPSDIPVTSFNVANNVASPTNITGLSFDPSQVRSAIISYSVSRTTSTQEKSEVGQIFITYSDLLNTWELAQNSDGSSGVVFTITPGGQLLFTSSNLTGSSYSAKLKFKAVSFLKA